MGGSDGEAFLDRADDTDGIDDGVQQALLAPILAVGAGAAMLVEGLFEGFTRLTDVLSAVTSFLSAIVTEPIVILSAGASTSAESVGDFGIAAFVVAVGVAVAGVLVADAMLNEVPLLDAILPWR